MKSIQQIGIIGLGNVGSHLTRAFSKNPDLKITVYNRSGFAKEDQIPEVIYTQDLRDLYSCELVLITVKDDAVIHILDRIEDLFPKDTIVAHCSGSIPSTIIRPYYPHYGVLYPLQTLSKAKSVNYQEIPIFITASDPETREKLIETGKYISPKIEDSTDEQRLSLHIAAIFACNYTNALYAIGERLCKDYQLDFNLLKPLIKETADKVQSMSPYEAQTGPAMRKDWEIIHQHEIFLSQYDENLRKLYREMADYISKNITS